MGKTLCHWQSQSQQGLGGQILGFQYSPEKGSAQCQLTQQMRQARPGWGPGKHEGWVAGSPCTQPCTIWAAPGPGWS